MGRLYKGDFYGWTQDQADALRRRSVHEIDWDNLLEEIEGLGASQRRELRSRLTLVIQHLLKWRFQPSYRSRSWLATIVEQRAQVNELLLENPSLRPHLDEIMPKAFRAGVTSAVEDTGFDPAVFEVARPMSFEEAMSGPVEFDQG